MLCGPAAGEFALRQVHGIVIGGLSVKQLQLAVKGVVDHIAKHGAGLMPVHKVRHHLQGVFIVQIIAGGNRLDIPAPGRLYRIQQIFHCALIFGMGNDLVIRHTLQRRPNILFEEFGRAIVSHNDLKGNALLHHRGPQGGQQLFSVRVVGKHHHRKIVIHRPPSAQNVKVSARPCHF